MNALVGEGMRYGFIKISGTIYRSDASWKQISSFFKDFIPIKVKYIPSEDCWRLLGWSSLFDEMPEGDHAPVYDVIFYKNDDGSYSYKFSKR